MVAPPQCRFSHEQERLRAEIVACQYCCNFIHLFSQRTENLMVLTDKKMTYEKTGSLSNRVCKITPPASRYAVPFLKKNPTAMRLLFNG
jgi:hypothetical protein